MSLTELQIRSAKAAEKPIKLFDSGGLYLLVNPNGSRWWRLKYRYGGKERGISLGVYPDVSLKLARTNRDQARRLIAQGTDPSAHRKASKLARAETFQTIAEEWLALQAKSLALVTFNKARWMLSEFAYPRLGSRPINEITPPDLLAALRVIEARGKRETAHRTKQRVRADTPVRDRDRTCRARHFRGPSRRACSRRHEEPCRDHRTNGHRPATASN